MKIFYYYNDVKDSYFFIIIFTGSYIQKLTSFFAVPLELNGEEWTTQKVSNVHYMLQVSKSKILIIL